MGRWMASPNENPPADDRFKWHQDVLLGRTELWRHKCGDYVPRYGQNFYWSHSDVHLYGMRVVEVRMDGIASKLFISNSQFATKCFFYFLFFYVYMKIMFGGMGLLSVGMAFVSAIGLCSLLGVAYGPVHTSLPFLLMGLGVDDIFVVMSCWRQVEAMNTGCTIPEKIGLMLKHAGSSITVTSITDVVAFLIGASTV